MAPIWLRVKSELRSRWRATVVLTLLIALVGSIALAAAVGARRTATAPDRLRRAVDGRVDVQILDVGEADLTAIGSLPMVERSSVARFLVSDTELDLTTDSDQLLAGQLVDGAADPADPFAAVVDGTAAGLLDLEVGDQLDLALYSAAQWEAQDPSGGPQGPHPTVRVAAVVRQPDDVDAADPRAGAALGNDASISLPQAFLDRYGAETGLFTNVFLSVQLRGGRAAIPDFTEAVRQLPHGDALQFLDPGDAKAATTGRAIGLQAAALALLAVAVVVAGTATVGQILVRHLRADAADAPTLRALGMTRSELTRVGVMHGAVVGTVGAALAVAGAVAWSPLTPVGLARQAEPHPGIDVNVTLLLSCGLTVALLVVVAGALSAHRRAGELDDGPAAFTARTRRGTAVVEAARGRAGAPLAAALSLAFGARASRLATRATMGALGTAVAAVAAATVLLASLDRVTDHPANYGWTFDAVGGNPFEEDPGELFALIAQTPGIEAVAGAANVALDIDGRPVSVLAFEAGKGIEAAPIEGRAPRGPAEIAIGRRTLDALGAAIGDRVAVDAGRGPVNLTVTGTVVVPELGGVGSGLGEGGVLTLEALGVVAPEVQPNLALLRFAPGARRNALAAFGALSDDTQPMVEAYLPASLYQFVRIRSLPGLVGVLAVVLALATLIQNLMGVGWARRRDLAVLKAVGFTRGQVTGSALWQATCFGAVALVVGLPLGVAGGRLAWAAVGRSLGIADGPVVPLPVLGVVVPAGLLLANLAASAPGWLAARRSPAEALRME